MKAHIVIGLGFGDEGKGVVTDHLCSLSPRESIVVRFSGGQQAGHTVMIDGKKHVHSNFGSGTLRGCPSYFSEHTTIYLNTLVNERNILKGLGLEPKLYVHPLAKMTTPYDVAWNRFWEKKNNHGSCGLGVAATHKRSEEGHYQLYAMDLQYPEIFRTKCLAIRAYYFEKLKGDPVSLKAFIDLYAEAEEYFWDLVFDEVQYFQVQDYSILKRFDKIVFEGSQGILLDQHHGFFPNVTWGNTTSKNAMEIIDKLKRSDIDIEIWYVTRCYQTRHGEGWMSNQEPIKLINNEEEINVHNPWQKNFKIGELDYDLLNYALDCDNIYVPKYKAIKNIVVTCLDQRPDFQFDKEKLRYTNFYSYRRSPENNTKKYVAEKRELH